MEVRDLAQRALLLDKNEVKKLKISFEYLKHRLASHNSDGLSWLIQNRIDVRFCDYVLSLLDEWK